MVEFTVWLCNKLPLGDDKVYLDLSVWIFHSVDDADAESTRGERATVFGGSRSLYFCPCSQQGLFTQILHNNISLSDGNLVCP